jgi:hypothetical protein
MNVFQESYNMNCFVTEKELSVRDYDNYLVTISSESPFDPQQFFEDLDRCFIDIFDRHYSHCFDGCSSVVIQEQIENCPNILNNVCDDCCSCEFDGKCETQENNLCNECDVWDRCNIPEPYFDGFFKLGDVFVNDNKNVSFLITSTKKTFKEVVEYINRRMTVTDIKKVVPY